MLPAIVCYDEKTRSTPRNWLSTKIIDSHKTKIVWGDANWHFISSFQNTRSQFQVIYPETVVYFSLSNSSTDVEIGSMLYEYDTINRVTSYQVNKSVY